MADTSTYPAPAEKAETRAQAEDKPELAAFWLSELEAAGKRDEKWIKRARAVVQRYRDEREGETKHKRANILWSNTEILKSALFGILGSPDVRRRFPKRGQDEKNTKQAALVMERGAAYSNDAYDCETQIEAAVEDMVLPGRGVCWVVYDAKVAKVEDDQEEITYQCVKEEHVFWEDYRCSSGRKDSDVWWKGRRHFYTRDDLREYFDKHADKVPLNAKLADGQDSPRGDKDDTFKRAAVWEIWDKTKRQRIWIAEDYPLILKREDDPYRLEHFFPCPEPLYGVKTTSSLEPIPEFTLYQDQADELDVIATRLYNLVGALKRRGVYDAGLEGNDNQLGQLALADDNVFLPFRGFSGLMEKGGLKQAFQTEDLAPLVTAIEGLYKRAMFLVQQIYEVCGIADVMRGSSDADETLGAQQLKANFGSMRLKKRQRQVQRFVRSLIRIKTEIIAEHFTREQLQEMVGLDMPLEAEQQAAMAQLQAAKQQMQMLAQMQQQPPMMGHNGGPPMAQPPPPDPAMMEKLEQFVKQPSWEKISAILRSDQRRGYKIDIETEETAQVDEQEDKAARNEFMATMMAMMEKAIPAAVQLPAMRPLLKECVMFVVKGHKAGRPLEESFEEAFAQLEKMPAPQGQGDPVADAKAKQIETQTKLSVQEAQTKQQTTQMEIGAKQQETQANMALKGLEIQGKQQELKQKAEDSQFDRQLKMREAQFNFHRKVEEAEMDREMAESNKDLAETTGRIEIADKVQQMRRNADKDMAEVVRGDQDHKMSMVERRQKMQLAERKANQPAQRPH